MELQCRYWNWLTRAYKVVFAYKGTSFSGFQKQPGKLRTVEGEFLEGLSKIVGKRVGAVVASGRTDAGVHAEGQVISFVSDCGIPPGNILRALNSVLPRDITVHKVEEVETRFHARYSAKSREYRYLFTDDRSLFFLDEFVTKIEFKPKIELFPFFSQYVVGTHDFSLFRCKGSTEFSTIKRIFQFELFEYKYPTVYNVEIAYPIYCLRIVGNSFLYKMVRNLAGAIFEVLRGKRNVEEFAAMLQPHPEPYKFTTAPPTGLCLYRVNYDLGEND